MRLDVLQSQLGARVLIQKVDQLDRVEAGVGQVANVSTTWFRNTVLPLVSRSKDEEPGRIAYWVAKALGAYWGRVTRKIGWLLAQQTRWSWDEGYQVMVDVLPRAYWFHLAAQAGVEVREGVDYSGAGSIKAAKELYQPMDRATVRRLVFAAPEDARDGLNWTERIQGYSRLTTEPATIAEQISAGLRAGKNPRQVAKDILPWVQNNATAANRLARTEMLRVSAEGLREQWAQFDDVIAGFKILATFDERTRPHHRTRHGDLYLKPDDSGALPANAKGTPDQRPIVPDEPNCRCYEEPVLLELPGVFKDVATKDKTVATMDGIQEDPVTMSRWFDVQNDGRKSRIVGPRRFGVIRQNLNRAGAGPNVTWADAVDTRTGKIVPVAQIRGEPVQAVLTRRAGNEIAFSRRASLLAQDREELFPGLKLVGRGGEPPLPPGPTPDPTDPPPPPPGALPHGLTQGQLDSIYRWQADGHDWTNAYYSEEGYKNWAFSVTKREVNVGLVRKVDAGLKKLPMVTTAKGNAKTVYRGLKDVSAKDLNALLQSEVVDWDNYQAASLSKKVAGDFANGGPGTSNVLLRMKSANGRDLRGLGGRAATEQTVMFERGRRWKVGKVVTKTTPNGGTLYEVLLEETVPTKDSPLFTKVTSPRKRLWALTPPVPSVTPPTPPPAKPTFNADPMITIRKAKEEMADVGLTKEVLQAGFKGPDKVHDLFWDRLRKLNGTASTTAGVRKGIMVQRKKILATFDRKLKAMEKALEDEIRAVKAAGSEVSPTAVQARKDRIRGLRRKREANAIWFRRFAETADESLVKDERLGTVKWSIGKKKRAAAYQWANEVKTDKVFDEGLSVYAHEFGHHVEFRNMTVRARLGVWRTLRAEGKPQKSVYKWNPNSKERGYPDKWYDGYAGRVYPGQETTEILSMGMQLTTTWGELAQASGKDFDHVAMMWAILRGY